jgi:hypothetical protein
MFRAALSRIVAVVAIAATASSVMFVLDGPLAWVTAAVVFAVVALLWRAAMCANAPWPLSTAWHYACKLALYTFAAEVVWAASDWAGPVFVVTAVGSELLQIHRHAWFEKGRVERAMVSPGAGRVA